MTSGLVRLTTGGGGAHRLMPPRYAVPRTYWLGVHGRTAAETSAALRRRVVIDGRPVRIVESRVREMRGGGRGRAGRGIEVALTLAEGRQRIVRRLAEQLGLKVEWLHRAAYGPARPRSLRQAPSPAPTPRATRG